MPPILWVDLGEGKKFWKKIGKKREMFRVFAVFVMGFKVNTLQADIYLLGLIKGAFAFSVASNRSNGEIGNFMKHHLVRGSRRMPGAKPKRYMRQGESHTP